MSLASNTSYWALRVALAGRWSPLGAVIAALLGTGYLVGLAGLVLLVLARPPSGPAQREVTIAVTIAGDKGSLPGVVARGKAALSPRMASGGAAASCWNITESCGRISSLIASIGERLF